MRYTVKLFKSILGSESAQCQTKQHQTPAPHRNVRKQLQTEPTLSKIWKAVKDIQQLSKLQHPTFKEERKVGQKINRKEGNEQRQ